MPIDEPAQPTVSEPPTNSPDAAHARLTTTIEIAPNATVVRVTGEIDLFTAPLWSAALADALADARARDVDRIVVDMTGVRFFASAGLVPLVAAAAAAADHGRTVRLAAASRTIATVLHVTRVDTLVSRHPTVTDAITDAPATATHPQTAARRPEPLPEDGDQSRPGSVRHALRQTRSWSARRGAST